MTSVTLWQVWASTPERDVFTPVRGAGYSTREAALEHIRRDAPIDGLLYYIEQRTLTLELVDQDYPEGEPCPK